MTHLLAQFKWWEWAILCGNLGLVIANVVSGEYLVAWLVFIIAGLFTTGAVYRVLYEELLEDYTILYDALNFRSKKDAK